MLIVCCIKQVPDTTQVQIDPVTNTLVRDGIPFIVNPYDTDQCAAALHMALTMPEEEQRNRMHLMRGLIEEFNVFRWAGRMLIDAASMRRHGRLLERAAVSDGWQTGAKA